VSRRKYAVYSSEQLKLCGSIPSLSHFYRDERKIIMQCLGLREE
jgi:hypothetical protein